MKFDNGFCTKVSCATMFLIPPDSVEIALDALFTIDIKTKAMMGSDEYKVKEMEDEKFKGAESKH
jgi:hypothetical protein